MHHHTRISIAGRPESNADRRFRKTVHREHRVSSKPVRFECCQKLLAKFVGNRFGAIEYKLHRGQVRAFGESLALEEFQEVLVTEIRRAQLGRPQFGRF